MSYKQTYLDFFGYCEQDFVPSELSGKEAHDIHHIIYRSKKKDDSIDNLIALTREEHDLAHRGILTREFLNQKHQQFIKNHNLMNQ